VNTNQVLRFNENLTTNTGSFDRVFASTGLNVPIYLSLPVVVVPEPSAVVLFALGVACLAAASARKAKGARSAV
jgi:hypothetical protein